MRYALIVVLIVIAAGFFLTQLYKNVWKGTANYPGSAFGVVTSTIPKTPSGSPSAGKPASTTKPSFVPPGFVGPTGPPHVVGPSGPPPNY